MSSLSYRKRSNLDSKGGDALFSALKENAQSEDALSFHKAKPKTSDLKDDTFAVSSRRKSQAGDDMNDRESVMSQAYSEATSRARKGMDSRWGDFDKESTISFSRASTRLGLSPENDAKSTISLGLSSPGRRRCTSRLDEGGRSMYSSSPSSPCFSRRSRFVSPGSVSQADSHMSLARSFRLSEFDVDFDDSRSVAFTERSAYSPHSSTGRSMSMPPPQARSSAADDDPIDNSDIKTVSHRNYLDPDLEKAINEVLSFKPIKFKRRSLEDSEGEEEKSKNDDDNDSKDIRNQDSGRPTSSLRRSASAVDCMKSSRSASSCSSRHRSKSKGKSKKKKRSHSSESDSSADDHHHRSSSKRRSKTSKKKSKKKDESSSSSSSSSDSESDSESESSSGASTISYRSSNSVKRAPARKVSSAEEEETRPQSESQPINKKDDKKRKKKVDSLMMKYLYRPDSDWDSQ